MRLYHRTTREAADCILREGFRDGEIGRHWSPVEHGVWIADRPFDAASMGQAKGAVTLMLDLPGEAVADYEIIEYDSDTDERFDKGYREWIVPAGVLNRWSVAEAEREPS